MSNYSDLIRSYTSIEPKSVEGLNNTSYFYYFNKLLKMIYSIFKFENVPDDWNLPYIKEQLFLNGLVVVTDTTLGVIALRSGYSGINVYGEPTDFIISNPVLGTLTGKIGEEGEVIYFGKQNGHYMSMIELLQRYAVLLAQVDCSLNTTLINSRVAHVFSSTSTAQMKTMQKTYDEITKGKPAVFIRKTPDENNDHVMFNNVKQSFIGVELLDVKRSIMNEFMSEIGINNANTQKKERLITSEVESNNAELNANIYEWFENIRKCIENVNKHYGLNIQFGFNTDVLDSWQKFGGVE